MAETIKTAFHFLPYLLPSLSHASEPQKTPGRLSRLFSIAVLCGLQTFVLCDIRMYHSKYEPKLVNCRFGFPSVSSTPKLSIADPQYNRSASHSAPSCKERKQPPTSLEYVKFEIFIAIHVLSRLKCNFHVGHFSGLHMPLRSFLEPSWSFPDLGCHQGFGHYHIIHRDTTFLPHLLNHPL